MNFEELVTSRHSAVNYIEDVVMTEEDFKKIFELSRLAPSAYNLQLTNYLVITDQVKKDKVYELSNHQYKIHTASAVIIVMGDRKSIDLVEADKLYSPMKMLRMIDQVQYEEIMANIQSYGEGLKSKPHKLDQELLLNSALHAAFVILSAKHYGFDTCVMHVLNVDELKKEFNIPERLQPLMLISIGKSVDKERPRGYRKPVGEFVTFNKF